MVLQKKGLKLKLDAKIAKFWRILHIFAQLDASVI